MCCVIFFSPACTLLTRVVCSNSFEVATPEATYYMYAESEKEKDEWIGAIGRCDGALVA